MTESILAVAGFIMVGVIVWGLIQSKITPVPVFVLVSVIVGMLVILPDYSLLFKSIDSGVRTTMPVAVLFIFSIIYFSLMNDVGLFDPFVDGLVKKAGTNVVLITVVTSLIAIIAHLDGALASTLLITVPAMLPIYKRLNMRPLVLLVIIGAAMSIMNLLPWGGPVARTAVITKTDITLLWHSLIPLQIVGCFVVVFFAAFLGVLEKKRGAGLAVSADGTVTMPVEELDPKKEALKRPKLIWFNALVTLAVILLLCFTKIPLYFAFMAGLAITLVVNFPNPKDQTARVKAYAGEALAMSSILLAAGVFLGILTAKVLPLEGVVDAAGKPVVLDMIGAMARMIISVIPDFMGPYLHIILGFFSIPIGMVLGTDSFFFGFVPLAMSAGQNFGIDPLNMAKTLLIGKNYGVLVTPHAATTYLAIGLAGVELKDHLKYCTFWLWILGVISMVIALIMGIIHL